MKRIAFILPHMAAGGPQRSLLNILYNFDYRKYKVTLILFQKGGTLTSELPTNVRIDYVRPRGLYCRLDENKYSYIVYLPLRIVISIICRISVSLFRTPKQIHWTIRSPFIKKHMNKYDLGIAYCEGISVYYLATKMSSKIKVARIPTDYQTARLNSHYDRKYLREMNWIFGVSEESVSILKKVFPEYRERIKVFKNIISPDLIRPKAINHGGFTDRYEGKRILTIARLDITKGIDIAIKTCHLLIHRKNSIKWYVIGYGNRRYFQKMIEKYDLESSFILMKSVANPYPYIKQSDIYVQPSRYEGNSNAINEAKVLCKPIVITDFATSREHIEHMINGIISDMEPESLSRHIEMLLKEPEIVSKLINNLKSTMTDNKNEVENIYNLLSSSGMNKTSLFK